MMPSVSVIVPVYNAEKTLKRCLDSLANQALEELEIICVDDGSTDRSGEICDEYARKDPRFKVFHKKNEGVSATRQFGVDNAAGEYVIHLDSDDYVRHEAYAKLYEAAVSENADIVTCDATIIEKSGQHKMDFQLSDWSHENVLKDLILSFGSVWNRLIRRSLLQKYGIAFPQGFSYGEDKIYLIRLLARTYNKGDFLHIVHYPEQLVYYDTVINDASLTKMSPAVWLRKRIDMLKMIEGELDMSVFGREFYSIILKQAYDCLRRRDTFELKDKDYKSLYSAFREGIKRHVPSGTRKYLVLLAEKKGMSRADNMKWILIPEIILDRIKS